MELYFIQVTGSVLTPKGDTCEVDDFCIAVMEIQVIKQTLFKLKLLRWKCQDISLQYIFFNII